MLSPTRLQSPQSALYLPTLANHSTITKMASYPCYSSKVAMKSMNILWHGLGGLRNGCKRQVCFWLEIRFTQHPPKLSQSELYLPLCTANSTSQIPLYGGFPSSMADNGTIIFFFENQQPQLALWHIYPTLLIIEQSIHQLDLFERLAFAKLTQNPLGFGVVNVPLHYLGSQVSFTGKHQPQSLDLALCLCRAQLLARVSRVDRMVVIQSVIQSMMIKLPYLLVVVVYWFSVVFSCLQVDAFVFL